MKVLLCVALTLNVIAAGLNYFAAFYVREKFAKHFTVAVVDTLIVVLLALLLAVQD